MTLLFHLLCLFAGLGAVDIVYFHIYRFRLFRISASRAEHLTHLVRTGLFLCVLLWVVCIEAHGVYSLLLPSLLLLDFLNSMADVLLEPRSRRPLGGLPSAEYAIHMLTMAVNGAILLVAAQQTLTVLHDPSVLRWRLLPLPRVSLALGYQIVVVTAGLWLFEGWGLARSLRRR